MLAIDTAAITVKYLKYSIAIERHVTEWSTILTAYVLASDPFTSEQELTSGRHVYFSWNHVDAHVLRRRSHMAEKLIKLLLQ